MPDPLHALAEAIEKTGLIKPGPRSLAHRIGFLLRASGSTRVGRIGRYLERRVATPGLARMVERKGKGRKAERVKTELFRREGLRTGKYNGVYTQPGKVRKSEHDMDALDALYSEIEKALSFRGQRMSPAQRRHAALGTGYRYVSRGANGKLSFMRGGRKGRAASVAGHQAKTTPGRKQREIAARLRIRKSEQDMTNVVDEFYDAVEEAGMVPRSGSSAALRQRVLNARKKTLDRVYRSDPYSSKGIKRASPRLFPKRRK